MRKCATNTRPTTSTPSNWRRAGTSAAALAWAEDKLGASPILFYATATPEAVKAVQAEIGTEKAGSLVEDCLAAIARGLVAKGVGQLIVAGGETSGAVVKALGISGLRIGPEIDPGVPVDDRHQGRRRNGRQITGQPLALALKSGNFGSPDFFLKAWSKLES